MIYGYARVSSSTQSLTPQVKALESASVEKIVKEKISAKHNDRPALSFLLEQLEEGDTLVITKLDRIARNVKEGIDLIDSLNNNGISLHVLNMGLFDSSPTSKLIRNILLSVAEWEREMLLERQREGIYEAKIKGKYKGRPKKYTEAHAGLAHALKLYSEGNHTVKEISAITKISKATIYRSLSKS